MAWTQKKPYVSKLTSFGLNRFERNISKGAFGGDNRRKYIDITIETRNETGGKIKEKYREQRRHKGEESKQRFFFF